MQISNAPSKLVLPFANAGGKNTIPTDSQIGITAGAASLTDGFPPLTRTPIAAGGVPPSGLDMNGILYEMSAIVRWANAGGGYIYDSTFANDSNVGGYPKGARVLRTDGLGYWFNTVDNNTTDPESAGAAAAGWVPDFTDGVTAISMTNANVTLTPLQYGKRIVVITGLLTGNLNLIFPAIAGQWIVVNNTTGSFSITCKTSGGTGVTAAQSAATIVYGDTTNIGGFLYAPLASPAFTGTPTAPTATQFDNSTKIATTGFGKVRGIEASAVSVVTATGSLTAAHAGGTVIMNNSSLATMTLPAANAFPAGGRIEFMGVGTANVSVQRAGSDTIAVNNAAVTSMLFGPGDTLTLESNGSSTWFAVGGSAQFNRAAVFASSLGATGYQKLPSGLIINWAKLDGTLSSTGSITHALAFGTVLGIVVGVGDTGGQAYTYSSLTTTGYNWSRGGGGSSTSYAITYGF